ncbi:MAG: hypothetical protein DMF78_17035 [Acidobacteria bacterium]|nr:MAG: hypothetical protein DMF78_17035 [Acidobacteriota bacterium]
MAKIIINPTSSSRREIALARSIVSIGRDPSNDVVLPDAMVSRRHAVIEYRGSQYFLRDCNSSNGSLVNGDRVSERNLRDGDLVAIGTARLLFREEAEDSGAKVVPHPSAPRQVCPSCQADYRKGDMFCRQCGTSLAPAAPARAVCTSCGTAVPLPARFCNACGQPLKDAPVARGGDDGIDVTKPRPLPEAPAPAAAAAEGAAAVEAASSAEAQAPEAVGESAAKSVDAQAAEEPPPSSAAPSEDPASSLADASPGASRAPRPLADSGARRSSSSLAEVARPAAPPALRTVSTPSPAAGPRPTPAIVRPKPEPARRPDPRPSRPAAVTPAGFGVRLVAALVDSVVVGAGQLLLMSPVLYYWWEHWWSHPPTSAADVAFWPILVSLVLVPVVLALGAVYYVYHWGVKGATPGKRLLGLVVQGEDGSEPIGLNRATVRVLGYLVSGLILGIGFLMIAFGGAGLHDRMAGTRVVRRERG